jgi:hypothetical protein
VERVVVTPLREGHCCGASRRNPAETEIARKINAQTASQQAWYVRIGCIRGAACAVYPPNCGHPSVALLDQRRLIGRTHAMVQWWWSLGENVTRTHVPALRIVLSCHVACVDERKRCAESTDREWGRTRMTRPVGAWSAHVVPVQTQLLDRSIRCRGSLLSLARPVHPYCIERFRSRFAKPVLDEYSRKLRSRPAIHLQLLLEF